MVAGTVRVDPLSQEQMEIPDSGQRVLIARLVDYITKGISHWHPLYNWDEVFTSSLRIPRPRKTEAEVVAEEHRYLDTLRDRVNGLRDRATTDFAPFSQVTLVIHREGPPGLFFPGIGLYVPFLVPTTEGVDMTVVIEKLFTQRVVSLSHLGTATRRQVATSLGENVVFLNRHFNLGLTWSDLETDHDYRLNFTRNRVLLTVVHTSDIQPAVGAGRN